MDTPTFSTRRILIDLCDAERRLEIARCFWRHATPEARRTAVGVLAKAIRFRDQKVKEAPVEKKAAWSVSRFQDPELATLWTEALAVFHLTERRALMAACLDSWGVPHDDGVVETDDYTFPDPPTLGATIPTLAETFAGGDLALYLATAGLIMGHDDPRWRAAAWPAAEALVAARAGSPTG